MHFILCALTVESLYANLIYRAWLSKEAPMNYSAARLIELSKFGMLMKWLMLRPCRYHTVVYLLYILL